MHVVKGGQQACAQIVSMCCIGPRYGAYEMSNDPGFNRNKLTLLNRGFIFAIAHVRGGGDMGRLWCAPRLLVLVMQHQSLEMSCGACFVMSDSPRLYSGR